MSIEAATAFLFLSFLVCLVLGVPLSFALGGVAVIYTYFLWGPEALYMIIARIGGVQLSFILIAVPMFILMASVLEKSGIAESLYEMMYRWLGPVHGGLAMGTVLICTLMAAMSGISGAAAVTMGLVALPSMLKRNYHKDIAIGCILSGAALGVLIPPSAIMIFYGYMTTQSVGKLFLGGVFPGLILSALFIIYIGIRCFLKPDLGPSVPREERATWGEKLVSLKAVILPIFLVFAVLGSIFLGITSVTEASAMGAFGSFVCAAIYGRLNWTVIREAAWTTFRVSVMIMWIAIAAQIFANLFVGIGGANLIRNVVAGMGVDRWVIFIGFQVTFFLMGMILDPLGIIMVTAPVFVPVIADLGFDPLWFGVVFVVNMEMSFLTPPFGWNLFYLRGVAPEGVTLGNIYHSVAPFVLLQAIGLVITIVFPQLSLWLPSLMARGLAGR